MNNPLRLEWNAKRKRYEQAKPMKSNEPEVSDLRQYLNVLGAQMEPMSQVDPALVRQVCLNINMAASDAKTPLPTDVFQSGLSDTLMRCALTGLTIVVVDSLRRMKA